METHQLFSILVVILVPLHTAQSSDTCSSIPAIIRRATTTSAQLRTATSLFDRNIPAPPPLVRPMVDLVPAGPMGPQEPSFPRQPRPKPKPSPSPSQSLNSTFQRLARRAGVKESPVAFNTFTRAVQEISIAEEEACTGVNVTEALRSAPQLIHQFQNNYRKKAGRDLQLLRSLIGKLLCIDKLEPLSSSRPASPTRAKRMSDCPSREECKCSSKGILSDEIFCICEFFACLDEGNVIREVFFEFNKGEECLIFVIDTTGSMGNEINLAKNLILQFVRAEEDIGIHGCYILVPFNDVGPDHKIVAEESVGPITIAETGTLDNLQNFYQAVNNLFARGGRDEPEYSLYAMQEGLRASLNGFDYVDSGSQMIVITDASSKQPELKNQVIEKANTKGVCIHFFLSDSAITNKGIYQDIAHATSGTLINGFSDWQLATFTQTYKENPCRHIEQRRKRQAVPLAFSRCQSFNVSEFSISIKTTLQATRSGVVTITRANRTRVALRVQQGNVTFFTETNPTPGQWEACVNIGTIEVFHTSKLLLSTIIVYINEHNNISVSTPTAVCTRQKIAVLTPQARKISNPALQFVNKLGVVQHSVALEACNGDLVSQSLTFPRGSFTYRITGVDSHGIAFKYDIKGDTTFSGCPFIPVFKFSTNETSNVILRRQQTSTIKFELSGNATRAYHFNLSSPLISGFRTRISQSSVTVNSGESAEISMLVTISNSRVSPGTTRTLTLIATSDDDIVVTATRRIVVAEEETSTCGCRRGKCIVFRGRPRCRCPAGYRGRKCEFAI